MKTIIVKNLDEYLKLKSINKSEAWNAFTEEFIKGNPNYIKDNETNEFCFNCTNCKNCVDCISCFNSSKCNESKYCSGCLTCNDCTNCLGCIDCYKCTDCTKAYSCTNCGNVNYSRNSSSCISCYQIDFCRGCSYSRYIKELNNFKNADLKLPTTHSDAVLKEYTKRICSNPSTVDCSDIDQLNSIMDDSKKEIENMIKLFKLLQCRDTLKFPDGTQIMVLKIIDKLDCMFLVLDNKTKEIKSCSLSDFDWRNVQIKEPFT